MSERSSSSVKAVERRNINVKQGTDNLSATAKRLDAKKQMMREWCWERAGGDKARGKAPLITSDGRASNGRLRGTKVSKQVVKSVATATTAAPHHQSLPNMKKTDDFPIPTDSDPDVRLELPSVRHDDCFVSEKGFGPFPSAILLTSVY